MSRVLLTGGTGAIGAVIVRRLLADPEYEVRVSDQRPAPQWMREGCEIHAGDLRKSSEAKTATDGCTHVIHLTDLAAIAGLDADLRCLPHTLIEANSALDNAVIRAALDLDVERFTYVSSALVYERASEFPTTEAYLPDCPTPQSAYGFSKLTGEVYCRAAHDEHGLQYTICRPFDVYGPSEAPGAKPDVVHVERALVTEPGTAQVEHAHGDEPGTTHVAPRTAHVELGTAHMVEDLIARTLSGQRPLQIFGSGEQTRTPTHVDDIAEGIITAMSSPRGSNEDFNISASRELPVAEIARIVWEACGEDPAAFALEHLEHPAYSVEHPKSFAVDVLRRRPAVEKARELLGWQARIELQDGVAATVDWIRARGSIGSPT
jgi:UDP-glucose 4-epimerase